MCPILKWFAIAAGLVAVLLRFALVNHRSAERSFRRIGGQAFWIAGTLTLGLVMLETLAWGD